MAVREIKLEGMFLQIPVRKKLQTRQLHFFCEGKKILEMAVPVGDANWRDGACDFYGQLPLPGYRGKVLRLEGDVPEGLLEMVCCSDVLATNTEKRPAYHFTPCTGWMNDPNGLVYAGGLYHYYFQHNPLDTEWQNMSWGHAVSKDLLHWEYRPLVLLPEEDGTIFSGSAIVNAQGLLGLPRDAIISFYTVAGDNSEWSRGKSFVQKMAASTDGGFTMEPRKEGQVPTLQWDNRDPKVFWHEESRAYVMIFWVEKDIFVLLRSKDLKSWEESQRFAVEEGFECPNLFRVFDAEGKESRWALVTARGDCYLGDFDGYRFIWDKSRQNLYCDTLQYAAQVYEGTPGRNILIPWLRTQDEGKNYRGAAGLPRELTLGKLADGSRVVLQRPVREYEAQKQPCKEGTKATEVTISLQESRDFCLEILLEQGAGGDGDGGKKETYKVGYDALQGEFWVGTKRWPVGSGCKDFRIFTDDTLLEVLAAGGRYFGAAELPGRAAGFAAAAGALEDGSTTVSFYKVI